MYTIKLTCENFITKGGLVVEILPEIRSAYGHNIQENYFTLWFSGIQTDYYYYFLLITTSLWSEMFLKMLYTIKSCCRPMVLLLLILILLTEIIPSQACMLRFWNGKGTKAFSSWKGHPISRALRHWPGGMEAIDLQLPLWRQKIQAVEI